ncbi:terminase small subunit [Jeotgalibaca porci]|uniref:terminase small subunit n=1 Tax=Jeotgalibaca porci TaxID=1868793 RepID=UPI0035A169A9
MKGSDEIGLSETLKQKYDLFVHFYMRSFNGMKAAKEVGYAEGTANRTATRILSNAYVKQRIAEEMALLRERLADEGSRNFAKLLDMVQEIEEKLQRHNEAMLQIEQYEIELEGPEKELREISYRYNQAEKLADSLDGRKKGQREKKAETFELMEKLNEEALQLRLKISELRELIEREKKWLIYPRDWEKIMTLKMNILHDLLDRGGFKQTDKIDLNADMSMMVVVDYGDEDT